MQRRLEYQFFVNMFNVEGVYSKKYLPGWRLNGVSSIELVEKWVRQHDEEKSAHPATFFSISNTFRVGKIHDQIENHFVTHLLVHWFEYQSLLSLRQKNNHAIGISILKDKYDHYHVFYLNKGHRSIKKTFHWFYVPPSQKNLILKLVSAVSLSNQLDSEKALNKLIIAKNTLSIALRQPASHKRGTCGISNGIKNVAHVESLISSIEMQDYRRYLHEDTAAEIKMDQDIFLEYANKFKRRSYQQAWLGAFEFAQLFESLSHGQEKISLMILFYQGMYNRFHKSHFTENSRHKLTFELAGMTEFFNRCLECKYYQFAVIMLFHFCVSSSSRRNGKENYTDFIEKLASLKASISLDAELLDMMVLDFIGDIQERRFVSAYSRFELLSKLIKPLNNTLYQSMLEAITQDNMDELQNKLSSPVDVQAFHEFTFLLSLENENPNNLSIIAADSITSLSDFLHAAAEMDKLKSVKTLIEEYKVNPDELNENGESALDLVAQCANLPIYQYLLEQSLKHIDSSVAHALYYQQDSVVMFVLKANLRTIKSHTLIQALSCQNVFDEMSLESALLFQKTDNTFILNVIAAAVYLDNFRAIQFFLDRNILWINQRNGKNNQTLLHFAACYDRYNLFISLLSYSPDLFSKNKSDKTPFRVAVDRTNDSNQFKIINFYLENHLASISEDDLTACLNCTVLYGKDDLVEKLLNQHHFSHDVIQHAFFEAINFGFVLIANLLMKAGASINEAHADGSTAMHIAVVCGGRMLAWVYENNGDIYAATYNGKSPIEFAGLESAKYLLIQIIKALHKRRCNSHLVWSWGDPVINLLTELKDIIKTSVLLSDLKEKCEKWCKTPCKTGTKIEVLYSITSIKSVLQPLLDSFLEKSAVKCEMAALRSVSRE